MFPSFTKIEVFLFQLRLLVIVVPSNFASVTVSIVSFPSLMSVLNWRFLEKLKTSLFNIEKHLFLAGPFLDVMHVFLGFQILTWNKNIRIRDI